MKKRYVLTVVALLLAVVAFAVPSTHVAHASVYNGTVAITCTGWTALNTGSHILDRDNTNLGRESLLIEAWDGDGTLIYSLGYSNVLTTFSSGIGSGVWTTAPNNNPITWRLTSLAGNGYAAQVDFVAVGECAGLPTWVGSDQVPIPAGSVVGSFVVTTALYTAPSADAATTFVMNAGQTLWVYGVDASGQYYQVQLAGQLLWVPVSTMGPNYDAVWNGTPLPTTVVK